MRSGRQESVRTCRYSKFNSSFGSGNYKAISLSRSFRETLQWQLQGGLPKFQFDFDHHVADPLCYLLSGLVARKEMFFEAGYTWQRGGTMNYDQFQFMIGKRF